MTDWDNLFIQLTKSDPYNKERSIHNCMRYYNHSQPWISHISLQGHSVSQLDMAKSTWWPRGSGVLMKKPIVWDEVMYEGNISCTCTPVANVLVRGHASVSIACSRIV